MLRRVLKNGFCTEINSQYTKFDRRRMFYCTLYRYEEAPAIHAR